MKIDKITLSNFRCFAEKPVTISMEPDLTCFVGNNGSGKTASIWALKRLFGTTAEERTITREDFYLSPEEDYDDIDGRQLYIEIEFSFSELKGDTKKARETCPAFSSVIYADDLDDNLKARIRLEASWNEGGYDDEVESRIYWLTTSSNVEFGEGKEFKFPVSSHDRRQIKLRYIPAFRDSKTTLKGEIKSLTKLLEDYTKVTPAIQKKIEDTSTQLDKEIQSLESIKTTTTLLKEIWSTAHDDTLDHYQEPVLEATPAELGKLLKSLSIRLGPAEGGGTRDISELSDGQISLLYFTLSIALYELEQKHHLGKADGFKELDKDIPIFTIFAFEEPENHLSPYYLGRVLKLLHEKSKGEKSTGIVTSHSASVVRRMQRVEQIRYFRQEISEDIRYSVVQDILLPAKKTEDDYKYISQAVLAHPELYFSKLVVLGEGDSEEIVLPQIAEKIDFDFDPSFVAFVKLGGRHVNHMWRLLDRLKLPHVTLLDLDWGRYGAGPRRIKNIIAELKKKKIEIEVPKNLDLNSDTITKEHLNDLLKKLERENVFFSVPLDLDMAMIKAFPACYKADGAQKDDRSTLEKAVLGDHSNPDAYKGFGHSLSDDELKKYRYLFCSKSKVASHYQAMAEIKNLKKDNLLEKCPDPIIGLMNACFSILHGEEDE